MYILFSYVPCDAIMDVEDVSCVYKLNRSYIILSWD